MNGRGRDVVSAGSAPATELREGARPQARDPRIAGSAEHGARHVEDTQAQSRREQAPGTEHCAGGDYQSDNQVFEHGLHQLL